MLRRRLVLVSLVLASLAACAPSRPPLVIRARDLPTGGTAGAAQGLAPGQPLVIEFDEGEEIPLSVSVEGDLAETPKDAAPIPIRVKRRFWLKIDGSKITTSRDGVHFGDHERPGSFAFGITARRGEPLRAGLRIVTPR